MTFVGEQAVGHKVQITYKEGLLGACRREEPIQPRLIECWRIRDDGRPR